MKKVIALFLFAFALCFFFACKHEPILPSRQVSFHDDIVPIVRSSCQHAGCHDPNDPNNEFVLDSVRSQYDNYVDAGRSNHSKLYESITDNNSDNIMPRPPYEPLTHRQIEFIYIWIAQGAKDN
ncbi:MAG: c-type cytochrome domain-containing protein [Bacteroidia bacterium]